MNTRFALYLIVLAMVVLGCTGLLTATAAPVSPSRPAHLYPPEPVSDDAPVMALADNPNPPTAPVRLVFVHHSTGGNWLASSATNDPGGDLGQTLMNNKYYVSATNYGWGPDGIGDRTDIGNWWEWFRGDNRAEILSALYGESGQNVGEFGSWPRPATAPSGENVIVMFKGCFPNAHLSGNPGDPPTTGDNPLRGQSAWIWDDGQGREVPNPHHTVANAKGIYNDILEYFATRQDKLFIVIAGPPLTADDEDYPTDAAHAANYRALNEWLVNDWLVGYPHNNVAVFDYYNVQTSNGGDIDTNDAGRETGNHHRWWNGAVQYVHPVNNDFSAYAVGGDAHPSTAGQQKATAEFVQLLNVFYNRWKGGAPPPVLDHFIYLPLVLRNYAPPPPACAVPLTGVTISGPTSGYTNTPYTFNASPTPSNATTPIAYTWSPAPNGGQGTASASYQWTRAGSQTINVTASNCSGVPRNDAHTITIQAPPSGSLVQPGDLVYQGAFRLPGGEDPPQTFAYGGNAMTFNPDGDPANTDPYPGSLFIMGHDRIAYGELPDGNQVAELSIPVPVSSTNLADLPYATFLQGFHNVAAGYFTELEEIPRVGMQYLNHPATGPKIHLAWGQHFQFDPVPSHAWFNPTLASPNLQGVWFIGNQSLYTTNGYMFEIPSAWADAHAQSRYLATGRMRDGGWGSMGPALFAYRPWLLDGSAPISGTHLAETTLLLYDNVENTNDFVRCMQGYQHPDEWEGGAWITTPSGKSAVLFAGTKSTGAKMWYGYINPSGPEYPCVDAHVTDFDTCRMADGSSCPAQDYAGCCDEEQETCVTHRGWWSSRWDAQFILYNPADLARVAAGAMESWEPQPYATLDVDEHLYLHPLEEDLMNVGWGAQRRSRIGEVAYDRDHGLLYVVEQYGEGAKPVVHVWRVQG